MELNEKNLNKFNNLHKEIFKELKLISDMNILLNGSFPTTFFSSDIDLYAKISTMSQYSKLCLNLANFLYNGFPSYLFFAELKIGTTKAKTINKAVEMLILESQQPRAINNGNNWIKLDIIALLSGYYEEVTIIYDFSIPDINISLEKRKHEIIKSFEEDIRKYSTGKHKNLFKVMKRLISLTRVSGQISKSKKLSTILNNSSLAGFIYIILARLEALKNVKDSNRQQKRTVLNNLKENVVLQIKSMFPELKVTASEFKMSNIEKIQKKLLKVMNDELQKNVHIF